MWKKWHILFPWLPKITADSDCRHEIKTLLLLGRKAVTNLDSIVKNRDITLPTKVCIVKAMVFSVVMYRCESLTIKKVEYWRIDAFELWCWRRLLRVPWTATRSKQSNLKEISPEYSLEGLMVKLKLQYFDHLIQRAYSLEKTLMLGKIEGRSRGQQRMQWLDGITDSMDMNLGKLQEMMRNRKPWYIAVLGIAKSWTGLSNWTTRPLPIPGVLTRTKTPWLDWGYSFPILDLQSIMSQCWDWNSTSLTQHSDYGKVEA